MGSKDFAFVVGFHNKGVTCAVQPQPNCPSSHIKNLRLHRSKPPNNFMGVPELCFSYLLVNEAVISDVSKLQIIFLYGPLTVDNTNEVIFAIMFFINKL